MKYFELEQIVKQLERFNLIDKVKNIDTWLSKLNQRQIDNFLNIELFYNDKLKDDYSILIENDFLNSDNYLGVVYDLSSLYHSKHRDTIIELLKNPNFIKGKHYKHDIKLLFTAGIYRASALAKVAINPLSCNSIHHTKDMEIIEGTKSYPSSIIDVLVDVACNPISLNSPTHTDDMNIIANCKQVYRAIFIGELAKSKDSIVSAFHKSDIKMISESLKPIAECLKDVAINENSLTYQNHNDDMFLIFTAKTNVHALCLKEQAICKESILSASHREKMNLISRTPVEKLPFISEVALKDNSEDAMYNLLLLSKVSDEKKLKELKDFMLSKRFILDNDKRKEILTIIELNNNELFHNALAQADSLNDEQFYEFIKEISFIKDNKELEEKIIDFYKKVFTEKQIEKTRLDALTNREKINIILNNAKEYKDSEKLDSKVFKLK